MRDPLHSLSVKHKLTLLFAILCLLSYGVGGVLVSSSARSALEHEIHRRIGYESHTAAQKLGQELELLARRVDDFASDGYVRERLATLTRTPDPQHALAEQAELERHLRENKLSLESAFVGLQVLGIDGSPLATAGLCPPIAANDASPVAFSQKTGHGDLLVGQDGGSRTVQRVSSTIRDIADGSPLGLLVAWIDTQRWVASALAELESSDDPVEIDSTTMLSIEDRKGTRLRLVPPSERRAAWTLVNAPPTSEHLGASGHLSRDFSIEANDWTVYVQHRTTAAFAPVAGLQSRVLAVGIVLAVLSGLLLIFPIRFLVQPLGRMRDAARQIREGDYTARVVVETSDEVGELGEAFNHMAEAVDQQTLRLRKSAEKLSRSERALRSERDRLEVVIQSLRDGLIVLDADGQAIMTNAAAEPLARELARRSAQLTSHFACGGTMDDAGCGACLAKADVASRMCVLDVGERVFEVHATSMPAAADGRRGRVLVARDITSRVAQDEREIHQERLSVLGEVAAVMAHELNNPLTSIRMFAQMLADQLPGDSPFQEHADVILRNTDTCRSSIRDLLGYATATAPIAADIDVHAVLHDVARFVRPLGERAHATLTLELEALSDLVSGDEIQLRQVFVNLVVNAVQAANHDGTQLTIRSRNVENWLEIDIEDTGSGVAPEVLPRLFDPFFSTKARGEGTGLGLSTARRIVELHGGRLELASSKPGLTTFRLRLPTRPEGQSTPRVAASFEGVS